MPVRWQTGGGVFSTCSTLERGLDRGGAGLVQVAVVGGAELHFEAHQVGRIGPVDDALGDEVLVRHQEFAAVLHIDRGVARAHVGDPAEMVADGDDVARLDRLVGEQDDAADEVRHDLLHAEADADADRAGEHRQHREVDADRAQHDDDGDGHHADADELAEQHLDRWRQPRDVLRRGGRGNCWSRSPPTAPPASSTAVLSTSSGVTPQAADHDARARRAPPRCRRAGRGCSAPRWSRPSPRRGG